MSIRPIDFNGMLQNNSEVGSVKMHEDGRGAMLQQAAQTANANNEQQVAKSVQHTENSDGNAFDMNSGGSGYAGDGGMMRKEKKEDKKKLGDGSVTLKNQHKSFDITV